MITTVTPMWYFYKNLFIIDFPTPTDQINQRKIEQFVFFPFWKMLSHNIIKPSLKLCFDFICAALHNAF